MMPPTIRFVTGLLIATAISTPGPLEANTPNILLILADDMGHGDMGCTGSQHIRTPHLDDLAAGGMLCRQAYVTSSVCSPSRAGLLTGRDPRRFGYEGNLNAAADRYATRAELLGLPTCEHTIADHLRAAGYATAIVGKWHLGAADIFHPNQRGFDHFCGMLNGSHGYFLDPKKNHLQRNGAPLREFSSRYITDFFTDEAVRWLTDRHTQNPEQAWFLYLSYNAPHTPMQATDEDLAACSEIQHKGRRTYAAMMRALDRGIGRVVAHLEAIDERDDTLIVFLSDNGGATNNSSWNGPFSGAKGCLREGGIRVPLIVNWPAHIANGSEYHGVASSLDLLPTFLAAAEAKPLPLASAPSHEDVRNRRRGIERYGPYDGRNLIPCLTGDTSPGERTLFWRLQGQTAVLRGNRKLIRLSHRPAQLFQPTDDPGEAHDLATSQPDLLVSLFQELGQWEAMLPTVPLWDSSPYWNGDSARIYDGWVPKTEPK